jgi:hypothetical protein
MASTAPSKMGLIQKICELEFSLFTLFLIHSPNQSFNHVPKKQNCKIESLSLPKWNPTTKISTIPINQHEKNPKPMASTAPSKNPRCPHMKSKTISWTFIISTTS